MKNGCGSGAKRGHEGCCGSKADREYAGVLICVSCEKSNLPDRRFCRECGARLGRACPDCCFFNSQADTFCGGCGGRLSEESAEALTFAEAPGVEPREERKAGKVNFRELFRKEQAQNPPAAESANREVSQNELDRLFAERKGARKLGKKAV